MTPPAVVVHIPHASVLVPADVAADLLLTAEKLEHELLAMNKNSVEYGFLSDVVSTNIKQLRMAISGTVS